MSDFIYLHHILLVLLFCAMDQISCFLQSAKREVGKRHGIMLLRARLQKCKMQGLEFNPQFPLLVLQYCCLAGKLDDFRTSCVDTSPFKLRKLRDAHTSCVTFPQVL